MFCDDMYFALPETTDTSRGQSDPALRGHCVSAAQTGHYTVVSSCPAVVTPADGHC